MKINYTKYTDNEIISLKLATELAGENIFNPPAVILRLIKTIESYQRKVAKLSEENSKLKITFSEEIEALQMEGRYE